MRLLFIPEKREMNSGQYVCDPAELRRPGAKTADASLWMPGALAIAER